jgi:hypothetical protein
MEVNWERDFNTGLARARDEGKLVFLDFFSPT